MRFIRPIIVLAAATLLASSPLAIAQTSTSPQTPQTTRPQAPAPSGSTAKPGQTTGAAPSRTSPLDINTASEAQLSELKGIGPARSSAIIAHRPYKSKDELVSRKVIPQNVYDGIKDQIVARQK